MAYIDRAEFERLADEWEGEIEHLSLTSAMTIRHTFRRIMRIGSDAIPWAFERLRTNVFWHLVLERLVSDPPKPSIHGDMGRLKAIWIAWGEQHGYLQLAIVGKPHAEETKTAFEQGLAEKIRQIQGAVTTIANKLGYDTVPMEGICELLLKIGRGEPRLSDSEVASEVSRIIKGD